MTTFIMTGKPSSDAVGKISAERTVVGNDGYILYV
jgi:hypothetical protein